MLKCKRYELIECQIPITGANGQNMFQNQPQLQSVMGRQRVQIDSIVVYNSTILAANPLSSITIAADTDIPNGVLTLVVAGTESIKKVPLVELSKFIPDQANYVGGQQDPFLLDNLDLVDWSKSYVTNLAAVASPISYVFGVYYRYIDIATGKIE